MSSSLLQMDGIHIDTLAIVAQWREHLTSIAVTFILSLLTLTWLIQQQKLKAIGNANKQRSLQRRMSNIGHTTLVTEVETNLSIPVSVMTLQGQLTRKTLVARLQTRVGTDPFFLRFRSLAKDGNFVEIPDFDVSRHVFEKKLDAQQTLLSFAESIVNTPLDFAKPLWEIYVLEDPQQPDKTHLAWKIHHCIGDGASLSTALVRMSDNVDQYEDMMNKIKQASKNKPKTKPSVQQIVTQLVQFLVLLVWSWWVISKKVVALCFPEPATVFKKPGGIRKRLSYAMRYSVAETKAIGKPAKATINDVMLTCVAGAMRRTLLESGAQIKPNLTLRAAIPVDMRGTTEEIVSSSNKFTALIIDMPLGVADPLVRLRRVRASMNEAKFSFEKHFTYYVSHFMSKLPEFLTQLIVRFSSSRVSIAISNVRGASFNIGLCGNPLLSFFGFVPPPPSVNLGIAILSVGDDLGLNALVDEGTGIDPKRFLALADEEFDALKQALITKNTASQQDDAKTSLKSE